MQKLDNLFIYLTHLDIPNSLKNKLMIIVVRIKLAFIENRIITGELTANRLQKS